MTVPKISSNNMTYGIQSAKESLQNTADDDFQRRLKSAMDAKDEEKLKKVCKDLEAIFVNDMLQQMRKTVIKSDLIQETPGRNIFESMFDEKIAEEVSKGKGVGLADMLYKQISSEMSNKYKIDK